MGAGGTHYDHRLDPIVLDGISLGNLNGPFQIDVDIRAGVLDTGIVDENIRLNVSGIGVRIADIQDFVAVISMGDSAFPAVKSHHLVTPLQEIQGGGISDSAGGTGNQNIHEISFWQKQLFAAGGKPACTLSEPAGSDDIECSCLPRFPLPTAG